MPFVSLTLLILHPASAIINSTVPFGNTSAPTGVGSEPSDPGFDYVGKLNGSTGVYLGYGWVLTANHVGAGTFALDGTNYSYNGVDSHQIGEADLRIFKLSTNPMLAPLQIATTSPTVGTDVVMIGAGRSPVSEETWHVDTDPDPWVWNTSAFPGSDFTASGYTTSSTTKTKRWGTNVVEALDSDFTYSGYSTPMSAIITDFDAGGEATAFESQAVTNDSGSGLFVYNGSAWELAGAIVTVATYSAQPGGASSALFGNLTIALDLVAYAADINSIIIPEPAAGAYLVACVSLLLVTRRRRR